MTFGAAAARDGIMLVDGNRQFGEGLPSVDPARARAFEAAARHSGRVKRWRRAILVGAALTSAGLTGYSYFRAQDIGELNFSLESFGISGDKITMEHPRLTGLKRDGKPYDVAAETGVQNPKDPSRTLLTKLNAKLRMADDSETRILGDTGNYDSNSQILDLSGHVHVKGVNFDLSMRSASMNFKTNMFESREPVRLDFDQGWIEADSLSSTENATQITFLGNVRSQFTEPPEDDAGDSRQKDQKP